MYRTNRWRASLFLMYFLIFLGANTFGQTADSSIKQRVGFFKGWRLAGISGFRSRLENKNITSVIKFFNYAATTDVGRQKLLFDQNYIQVFPFHKIFYYQNSLNTGSFEAVFKPKTTDPKRFKSYVEGYAGIDISVLNINMVFSGQEIGAARLDHNFITAYTAHVNSLNLRLGATVQTPAIMQVVSFYAGAGICFGATTFQQIRTDESLLWDKATAPPYDDTTIIYYQGHNNFKVGPLTGGVVFPVGIKFNISPHSNFFVEFDIQSNSYLVKKEAYTQWFMGWGVGYRYKLLTKSEREARKKSVAANAPEPFY
jgi:hypothetical protein